MQELLTEERIVEGNGTGWITIQAKYHGNGQKVSTAEMLAAMRSAQWRLNLRDHFFPPNVGSVRKRNGLCEWDLQLIT